MPTLERGWGGNRDKERSMKKIEKYEHLGRKFDRLCGLVVRVFGNRSRSPGFDSWRYQIF
jgi:hypothetical protein